jgi:hypothetical protein
LVWSLFLMWSVATTYIFLCVISCNYRRSCICVLTYQSCNYVCEHSCNYIYFCGFLLFLSELQLAHHQYYNSSANIVATVYACCNWSATRVEL